MCCPLPRSRPCPHPFKVPHGPTILLYIIDCPRLRCQSKPQTACGRGSCCLRHESPTPQESDSRNQSHLPNGTQKVMPTTEETESHSRSAARRLEAAEATAMQEPRGNEGEEGLFLQELRQSTARSQQGGADDARY